MSSRSGWSHRYLFSWQKTSITTSVGAVNGIYGSTDQGLFSTVAAAGKCGIILDNKPTIDPGVEHINTPKANGISQEYNATGRDFAIGKKMPTAQLVMGMNCFNSAMFGAMLFQSGATEATSTPWAVTCIPPVAGAGGEVRWCNFGMAVGSGTDADGYSMTGAICNSMAISGEEGGRMVLTADLMGHSYTDAYDHDLSEASDFTVTDVADELFFNYDFTLAGTAVSIKAFDCTIVNNAIANFYASQLPQSYSLGMIGASGNIRISMADATIGGNVQIDNYIAGTDVLLVGTYTGKNVITVNMKYNGAPNLDPAEETILELPYTGVYDGTNHAIQLVATNTIDNAF